MTDVDQAPSPAALLSALREKSWTLALAETDTGGLLMEWLIGEPGSSAVVLGGVVAYHNTVKQALLQLPEHLLLEHGAVSAVVAAAMAESVRNLTGANLGLASTGIAGPTGATPGKPVGLAFIAAATGHATSVRQYQWEGDRAANRRASARAMLDLAVQVTAE